MTQADVDGTEDLNGYDDEAAEVDDAVRGCWNQF
jgi:hypothetical protein